MDGQREQDGLELEQIITPESEFSDTFSDATAAVDIEKHRANLQRTNPQGASNVGQHGVDVSAAEHDFMELTRQLSIYSQRDSRRDSLRINDASADGANLEQQAAIDGQEPKFHLETHLRGMEDEERQAGLKSKQIGEYDILPCLTVSYD